MRISTVYLSERSSGCTPDSWRLFVASHWIPMEASITDPKTKDQKRIVPLCLSDRSSDCTPDSRRLFAVIHWWVIKVRIIDPKKKNEKRIRVVCLSGCVNHCRLPIVKCWQLRFEGSTAIHCLSLNACVFTCRWSKSEELKDHRPRFPIEEYWRLCSG